MSAYRRAGVRTGFVPGHDERRPPALYGFSHHAAVEDGGKVGVGRCSGTFGELLQGALPAGGREFLVTLPITRGSTAEFAALPGSGGVDVSPAHKEKSRRLAEELLRAFGGGVGGTLRIRSELPEGKGLASSSADMVATARAVGRACGFRVPRRALARMMGAIEPTDGVMYGGIVSYYPREGVLRRSLGTLPALTVVALDEGGRVETRGFHGDRKSYGARRLAEYEGLLLGLERAVRRCHLRSIGEISTRSAVLNQDILPKAHLDLFVDLRARYGALGVVAAHSGTVLGLLLDPASPRHPETLPALTDELTRHHLGVRVYSTRGPEDPRRSRPVPRAPGPMGTSV